LAEGSLVKAKKKSATQKLKRYNEKRDFKKTPEPAGKLKRESSKRPSSPKRSSKPKRSSHPMFVIQKHDATRLHYDLRLEIDGVLRSWAVPKGPSMNPADKRLAVLTEDHPMAYGSFEGVIPEGQYGAGPVIVWDTGVFENIREHKSEPVDMQASFDQGKIEVVLLGKKLEGGFALIRSFDGDGKQWLLIKMKDE